MKHYFFKGKIEKGKIKVYPVSGQMKGSTVIDETLRVSCPRDIRSTDLDTVYVSDDIVLSVNNYYVSKNFRVLPKDGAIKDEWLAFSGAKEKEEESAAPSLSLYERLLTDKALSAPKSDVDGFFMQPNDWGILVRNVQKHINTMVLGSSGTGKTSCIKVLCERLGLKLHIFDMGSMIDPISSLLGVHRLEDGASIFDYAKFTQVIQEPCVILLDELSRAPQTAMNILFPCLDDRRSLSVEIACGKGVREIKIHPEVTFIATANVGAEYSGTNSMDRALVDRFFTLELGYIPSNEESAVLSTRTGLCSKDSDMIVKVAGNIRSLAQKQEVSVSPSIRETLLVAELVADGWSLGEAMQMVYLPLYEGTKSEGERGTIYKTLSSY
jgi:AAA+ superfamily predicted ATPase